MTFEELKAMDDTYVMHTYARFPVDIDHGQGATLYSLAGKEYIDFTSGIGVNSLGYGDPTWIRPSPSKFKSWVTSPTSTPPSPAPSWRKNSAPARAWTRCSLATPVQRPTKP